ncbi:DNA-directed RNA polymerase [Tricladium varicosporioides]|nr:DNA-directed RNA polymerase [Hymenoscyphus varicosporioides]
MKNPNVEFCGYSIPHPSEDLMNIRIQTYAGTTATEALEKGFNDLIDLCDVVENKFEEARSEFESGMQT